MDDFSPAAVARKVEALKQLLEARQQLANLITYMDGKTGAEELIAKVLKDPALLQVAGRRPQEPTPRNSKTRTHRGDADHEPKKQSTRAQPCRASSTRATSSPSLLQEGVQAEVRRAKSAVEQRGAHARRSRRCADQR